jgi:DNA-binding NarL/FixJ family response regulator
MRTSILLVDGNRMLREGLRSLLAADGEFAVIGEAGNEREAVECAVLSWPDLMLIDSQLPGASAAATIAQIKRRACGVRVVVLTPGAPRTAAGDPLADLADACVPKHASFEELRSALRSVVAGCTRVGAALAAPSTQASAPGLAESTAGRTLQNKLTPRERSILESIAQGRTNRATAVHLGVSQKTVEKHRANLMRKLLVRDAAALMTAAAGLGLSVVHGAIPGARRRSPQRFAAQPQPAA